MPATHGRRQIAPTHSFSNLSNMAGTPRGLARSLNKFPSARVIEAHALEAAGNAAKWAQSAFARAGTEDHGEGGGGTDEKQRRLVRIRFGRWCVRCGAVQCGPF